MEQVVLLIYKNGGKDIVSCFRSESGAKNQALTFMGEMLDSIDPDYRHDIRVAIENNDYDSAKSLWADCTYESFEITKVLVHD